MKVVRQVRLLLWTYIGEISLRPSKKNWGVGTIISAYWHIISTQWPIGPYCAYACGVISALFYIAVLHNYSYNNPTILREVIYSRSKPLETLVAMATISITQISFEVFSSPTQMSSGLFPLELCIGALSQIAFQWTLTGCGWKCSKYPMCTCEPVAELSHVDFCLWLCPDMCTCDAFACGCVLVWHSVN